MDASLTVALRAQAQVIGVFRSSSSPVSLGDLLRETCVKSREDGVAQTSGSVGDGFEPCLENGLGRQSCRERELALPPPRGQGPRSTDMAQQTNEGFTRRQGFDAKRAYIWFQNHDG